MCSLRLTPGTTAKLVSGSTTAGSNPASRISAEMVAGSV